MSEIMGISRLRIDTDGEGVTTLVAFYGCPLSCKYCINSQCNKSDTIRTSYTVKELYDTVSIDDLYFRMTNGGVTFGGGEPLLQSDFIHKFCNLVAGKWKIRIETSLNVDWRYIENIINDIDEWYIDLKDTNPKIYKQYTGCDNDKVMENYKKLIDEVGSSKICVRLPEIPDYNTNEDIKKSIEILKDTVDYIDIFKYIRC